MLHFWNYCPMPPYKKDRLILHELEIGCQEFTPFTEFTPFHPASNDLGQSAKLNNSLKWMCLFIEEPVRGVYF
jgi:hypothetical protein